MQPVKAIGIALISGAIFLCGIMLSRAQGEPLKYAKAFLALITRLRSQIEYSRGELRALFLQCTGGEAAPLEAAGFIADAAELGWDAALEKFCNRFCIDAETRDALFEFGGLLGKTGVEEQLANCERAAARLGAIIGALAPETAKKAKMWRTLGASGALMAALILL